MRHDVPRNPRQQERLMPDSKHVTLVASTVATATLDPI